tara:strand:+ start:93 stop:350 length:258 start_codon:yes stop_codon:yes gene_type:complete
VGEVISIECSAVELPANTSNKRFTDKAKKLTQVSNDVLKVRDYLQHIDTAMLIEIPLMDSSSLSLYTALIESLELDSKRILERLV